MSSESTNMDVFTASSSIIIDSSGAENSKSPEKIVELPINTLYDAFAQIASINIHTMGKIAPNYKGIMAVWKKVWPTSNNENEVTLRDYSQVQIEFIKNLVIRADKLIGKNCLDEGKKRNLKTAICIIQTKLDEL